MCTLQRCNVAKSRPSLVNVPLVGLHLSTLSVVLRYIHLRKGGITLKVNVKYLFMLSLLALISFAAGQSRSIVVSPRSIIVNPSPSFDVEVSVDKDSSGNNIPSYDPGDPISITVRPTQDSYIYLFNVRSNGEVTQILPNELDDAGRSNFVRGGQAKTFPPSGANYRFTVDRPLGLDKVIAVASRNQLSTRELVNFEADPNFASRTYSGDEDFARALSIVIEPISQDNWVTDTALFYVGSQPPTPTFGTIQVNSNPSGADVFVDGRFVGTTPVSYGARAGNREVVIELSGYETFSRVVDLRGGGTASISTDLRPIRRTGTVSFTSTPSGAEVFLNGRSLGTTPTGSVTLDEGSYEARYSLPGYQETTVSFSVSGGQTQTVSTELTSLRGSLVVDTNVRGARVFINGTSYGTLQTGRGSVDDLPTGTHQLTVVADGYNTVVTDFIIRGGRTTELSIDLVLR